LHGNVSNKFCGVQFAVEFVSNWRVRCRWPPPHVKEHCDHWLQFVKLHVQLTPSTHGHGLPVQDCVSTFSFWHNGFGWDGSSLIKLCLRVWLPVWPQRASHLLHSDHGVYWQSSRYIEWILFKWNFYLLWHGIFTICTPFDLHISWVQLSIEIDELRSMISSI
jgi:hypothetical protein